MLQARQQGPKFAFTHELIARALGVNRPVLTTIAGDLKERKIISYLRGHLEITDLKGLEDSACSCYLSAIKLFQTV